MEQWESVIIKWVNCLKLSAPLTSLSHLKDGLFLGNLLKLFTQCDSGSPKFLLPTIIHFLKKQYPNFILDCNNYTDLQELEQNDLIMISSLLLHFSCIRDRRDVLTSPLCDQLSKATQTCIKFYLENVGNDINNEKLCQLIGESINIQKIQSKPYILSSGYSFQDSSLQQLLNTPVLKSRYRDKYKEINKLRAEIDLERYEKFELQDTLSIQKECNRKLSQQVSSKAAEITKLRTELTELESKIFSDSPNHTWNELQQRYQKEISNLEQYISQLQTEQDLLQNEKEQISNKVTKLQTEYLLSQERVILTENSYEQLLEKQKQQEDELENLHIHCSELSNLLEELRSNKISSDSCVELDTSSVDVNNKTLERSENLACHVVEVQLRDALQENMNVKSLLKQSQADVLELSSRIEEISASNQQLNTEKKELLLKVNLLDDTEKKLQKTETELNRSSLKLAEVLKMNMSLSAAIEAKDASDANVKLVDKLEEILQLEKAKQALQLQVDDLCTQLNEVKNNNTQILEAQARIAKEVESKAMESVQEIQSSLLKQIEALMKNNEDEKHLRADIELSLQKEQNTKELLETKISELMNNKSVLCNEIAILKCSLQDIFKAFKQIPEFFNDTVDDTDDVDKCGKFIQEKLEVLKEQIVIKKDEEISNINIKAEELQISHDIPSAKPEQIIEFSKRNIDDLKGKNSTLEQKLAVAENKLLEIDHFLKKIACHSVSYKTAVDKLVTERNFLESVINSLKYTIVSLQAKTSNMVDDREAAKLKDQIESFQFIVEDIQKQFGRISKKVHEILLNAVEIPSKFCDIVNIKCTDVQDIFEFAHFDDELENITDCRSSANSLLEHVTSFENSIGLRISKVQKENVLRSSSNLMADVKIKDEDLKKKNTILKQRLTLSENAKSNLEKKVKQLRQENKILNDKGNDAVMEKSCKQLLQQQITQKDECERKLSESCEKFKKLHQEYLDYKANHNIIPDQMKINKESKTEQDVKSEKEIMILRDAYGNLMSQNSKLELENATMRKVLEDRTAQLSDVRLVKEGYEKLLEENNTLRMDLDTLKYKRAKDREALFEAISKDKNENKKIQDVRIGYEAKLERMKEKMVQLYKEEMSKETQKLRSENVILFKKNKQLNEILLETKMGMRSARGGDRDTLDSQLYFSSESFFGVSDELQSAALNSNHKSTDDPIHTRNFITTRRPIDDRKCATLPKASGLNVIQEKKECKSNTLQAVQPRLGQNLEMEDEEEDLFNNKYLGDLKSGKCLLPNERESNASRLSELKWRNSLCPPHLKSCYPAETQFNSPTQFKENELKLGLCEFDDSMSTKLLPGEKPRKKDIGTTSHKKPGPPTPSKNGGHVSLQGGEIQSRETLRDHNEAPKTPKRNTPSRLKSLFKGRNTSTEDNIVKLNMEPHEVNVLSMFRKQK